MFKLDSKQMKSLTAEGDSKIRDIAERYTLSKESVLSLLKAVINGNGTMAQFNIPELGGSGQWMKGGMTMVGDMFNRSLKITVDQLCSELANLAASEILFQNDTSDSEKSASDKPWPAVFGSPTTSGSQNNFRYAYFAPVRRLVIETDGIRSIYDTKHHHISGVSQQQGVVQSYILSSQEGPVNLTDLSLISEPGIASQPTPELAYDQVTSLSSADTIFVAIEKLSDLFEKGTIDEEEFKAKKSELLSRL